MAKPYYYMQSEISGEIQYHRSQPPVSIIICIKSSNNDLYQFLSNILDQDYPEFEVIAVTDGISDEDEEALIRLKNLYPNLYSTHVPDDTRNVSRKKLALTLGIKAAKYDKLLFTEPDCMIRTNHWISLIAGQFSDKKTIVLGFSAFENARNIFYKYMAYDYFVSNLQMISSALFNHPYAGNGRNMAYSKEHFIEQKGFVKHRTLQHGEDDLFINDIATGENTAIELSAQSITITEINDSNDWKQWKADRMSTQRFYKRGPVAFYRLEAFLHTVFYMVFVVCLIYSLLFTPQKNFVLPGIALFCLVGQLLSQGFIMNRTAERLQLGKFLLTIVLFDLFQPFIDLYFFAYQVLKGKENYTYHYEKR